MKQGVLFVIAEFLTFICLGWLAFFYFSDTSRKPIVACAPLYYVVGTGARAATSAIATSSNEYNLSIPQKITMGCLKYVDRFVNSYSDIK